MSWKIRRDDERDDERYYVDAYTMPGAQKALRLAAAAPDLLAACEGLLSVLPATGHHAIDVARAAIAKAKGHTVQETDRLRAKKKQIYEDLQGAVNVSVEGLRSGEEWQARARAAIAKAKGEE